MAIHAIGGKPGGGKSFHCMKLIERELRSSTRMIVTNIQLKLPEIAESLHKEYGETFGLLERVRILTDSESYDFWLHRDVEIQEKPLVVRPGHPPEILPDFSTTRVSVCYIIDEFHIFFNAREWQKTGKGGLFYVSQHRKLSDTVIWVTQVIGNVEKQFRGLTQDFTYLRNHRKEKVFSVFKSLPLFTYAVYQEPFTGSQQASEKGTYALNVDKYGKWYDTASGVGITGMGGGDKGERAKGLPVWTIFIFIAIIAVGFIAFIRFGSRGVVSALSVGPKAGASVVSGVSSSGSSVPSLPSTSVQPSVVSPVETAQSNSGPVSAKEKEKVYLMAVVRLSEKGPTRVFLSDGREMILGSSRELVGVVGDQAVCLEDGIPVVYRRRPIVGDPSATVLPVTAQPVVFTAPSVILPPVHTPVVFSSVH